MDISKGLSASILVSTAIYCALISLQSNRSEEYPPAFLPLLETGLPYDPNCVAEKNSRPYKPEKFGLCTVSPEIGSGLPTLWLEGDSHAGHLQGLLYKLHEDLGIGIHLIETPGVAFPFSPGRYFASRELIHEKILENAKPGDVIVVSRLYFQRAAPVSPNPDIDPWIAQVSLLANVLQERGLSLVVIGPTPMFAFSDIRECDLEDPDACNVSRSVMASKVGPIMEKLNGVGREHDNVFVFDTFSNICPATTKNCRSGIDGTFIYRDRDHLNSYGATLLAGPFVDFLRVSNILTRGK